MADSIPTRLNTPHTPPTIVEAGTGADWLQLDGPAIEPEEVLPSTMAAPPWVAPDSPPTLDHVHIADHALKKPDIPGYEVVQEIGRGGMGVVYKARQIGLNRWVALKMILGGVHAGSKDLARFHAEAEAVARLRHPNIVQIYEIGIHQDLPFLALEFIDGSSLHEVLSGMPQPPREAASLVATLARAMHAAHERGILHRDLKPGNILLERKPELPPSAAEGKHTTVFSRYAPRITDFGLAKRLGSDAQQTKSDEILGTPSYMSPEQAAGRRQEIGPASDVYSLGAILYEMLTGFPPFRGAAPMETVLLVLTTEAAPPRRFRPTVPRDLETICLKCLQKDPHRRYLSAEALAEDLRCFLYGEPIQARPVSMWEKTWRWCRRNPAVAALTVAILVLVLGGSASWYWQAAKGRHRLEETERQVNAALEEALRLRGDAKAAGDMTRFGEALGAARRARTLADQGVSDVSLTSRVDLLLRDLEREEKNLREEAHETARDRRLLTMFEEARLSVATLRKGAMDSASALPVYRKAFQEYGVDLNLLSVSEATELFKRRPIAIQVAAALDDWSEINAESPKFRSKIRQLAKALDPDPWRNRLRDALAKGTLEELIALADSADMAQVAPASIVLLGNRLRHANELTRAVVFYRRAQWQHPTDYWINLYLGLWVAHEDRFGDACRFYSIAVALKPQYPVGHFLQGLSLLQQGRLEDAIVANRKCIALKPDYFEAHGNLASCLSQSGRQEEAELILRHMLRMEPRSASAHRSLGEVLVAQGEFTEALQCFRKAADLPVERTLILTTNRPQTSAAPQRLDLRKAIEDCERLVAMDQRYQEYLQGDPEAVPPAGVLELARFARDRKRQVVQASKLFAQAFERDPALLEAGNHRYDAARTAVLAGFGQGKEAAALAEKDRQLWRKKALAWLTADLEASKTRFRDQPSRLRNRLRVWLQDPLLIAVREPERLLQLPKPERGEWEEFWQKVGEQLAARAN